MKRNLLPLLLGFGVLVSGCAATSPGTQAASQEWRLQSLEESFLDFQEAQRREAERARAADEDLAKRIARLEQRVTAILGSGEDLPPETAPAAPSMGMAPEKDSAPVMPDAGGDMTPAEPAPPAEVGAEGTPDMNASLPAPVQAGPQSDEEKPWEHVPGPALEAHARKPAPPAPKTMASAAPATSSAQSLYDKGLNLVRSGRTEQGRSVLEGFLKSYPNNKLAPNAMYWIGESWYGEKNYPQAILAFKDVVAKYPKHAKAQAALLKIGMSFRNVGDKDNAVFYLRTLVDDHPGSEPARMAEQLLREIPN